MPLFEEPPFVRQKHLTKGGSYALLISALLFSGSTPDLRHPLQMSSMVTPGPHGTEHQRSQRNSCRHGCRK